MKKFFVNFYRIAALFESQKFLKFFAQGYVIANRILKYYSSLNKYVHTWQNNV